MRGGWVMIHRRERVVVSRGGGEPREVGVGGVGWG